MFKVQFYMVSFVNANAEIHQVLEEFSNNINNLCFFKCIYFIPHNSYRKPNLKSRKNS